MESNLIKIILFLCIVIFIKACHTFEHQNIFFQNNVKNLNQKLVFLEENSSKKNDKNLTENNEMAPIEKPKKTEKVQKLALQKKVISPNSKNFNLKKFLNWNEEKLVETLGKSDFIKEEGKLKNYQYYFKECFLDVFLLSKNENYIVNYIEARPTKLYGEININKCFEEITKIMN